VVVALSWKLAANGMFNGCKENEKTSRSSSSDELSFPAPQHTARVALESFYCNLIALSRLTWLRDDSFSVPRSIAWHPRWRISLHCPCSPCTSTDPCCAFLSVRKTNPVGVSIAAAHESTRRVHAATAVGVGSDKMPCATHTHTHTLHRKNNTYRSHQSHCPRGRSSARAQAGRKHRMDLVARRPLGRCHGA
jgi:hypothetical protein